MLARTLAATLALALAATRPAAAQIDIDICIDILPFPFLFPPFTDTCDSYWLFPAPPPAPVPYKTLPQTVAFACFGGGGNCECPTDLDNNSGVLINVWPGYQCAYPGGACTWDDKTGALQNTEQTNCPATAPCSTVSGCSCPTDLDNNSGVLINQFTGYQCAYPHGACTWDASGALQNTQQTNCPQNKPCSQPGQDS